MQTDVTSLVPMLHVVPTRSGPLTVDPAGVLFACLVFGVVLGVLWRSSIAGLLGNRAGRRRVARGIGGALLFLAILPAVVPYDHILLPHHDDSGQSSSVHQMHCHDTPGSCSDQPMTSGPGEFLFGSPLIVAPSLVSTLLATADARVTSFAEAPATPPPQA